jgi:hypothetical protein
MENTMKAFGPAICILLAAALPGSAGAAAAAKKLKDTLTGDAVMKAADNPQCQLFTQVEIAKFLGQSVKPGENAAGGAACQWLAKNDDESDAMIQVVPSRYFVPPSGTKGFKGLPHVGTKGFVSPQYGGWSAGALVGDVGIWVNVTGTKVTDATAIALLEETIKRRRR